MAKDDIAKYQKHQTSKYAKYVATTIDDKRFEASSENELNEMLKEDEQRKIRSSRIEIE